MRVFRLTPQALYLYQILMDYMGGLVWLHAVEEYTVAWCTSMGEEYYFICCFGLLSVLTCTIILVMSLS